MEKKLRQLFDYQKFANNEKLASLINETLEKYSPEDLENSSVVKFDANRKKAALSDDELFGVNAAMGSGSGNSTVTCYCDNCKKQTQFIVYSGARGKCTVCGCMKDI